LPEGRAGKEKRQLWDVSLCTIRGAARKTLPPNGQEKRKRKNQEEKLERGGISDSSDQNQHQKKQLSLVKKDRAAKRKRIEGKGRKGKKP